jgi:hypothetical protein
VVIAGGEVVIPIYVGEAHAGGLGGELLAEFGGFASWQQGESFENDAMFGILPAVGAELGGDRWTRCMGERMVCTTFCTSRIECGWSGAERAKDSGFEVKQLGQVGHGLRRGLLGSAELGPPNLTWRLRCAGNHGPHEVNAVNCYGDTVHWRCFARDLRAAKSFGAGTDQDGRATLSLRRKRKSKF